MEPKNIKKNNSDFGKISFFQNQRSSLKNKSFNSQNIESDIACKDNMIKVIDGIRALHVSNTKHKSYGYTLINNNGWKAKIDETYVDFKKLKERKVPEKIPYYKQLREGSVDISCIGGGMILVGDFILRNGERKALLICNTMQKKDGLWAGILSGYVNNLQAEESIYPPTFYTMYNEVHEELLLWNLDGEAVKVDFGLEPWPIFGQSNFKESIKASKLSLSKFPWLKTMPVEVEQEGILSCYYNKNHSSLRAIDAYKVPIDLRRLEITSSETLPQKNRLIEQYFDGQGEESHIILLPINNVYGNVAYKPDKNSESGLVQVKAPDLMQDIFNIKFTKEFGFAASRGDWYRRYF